MDSKALLEQLLQVGQELAKQGLAAAQGHLEKAQDHIDASQEVITDKLTQGQAVAQEKLAQGHEVAKDVLAQGQAIAKEKLAQGQAIAKEKLAQGQEVAKDVLAQGHAIAKDKLAQGQAIAEEKLGIPDAGTERDAMLAGLGKGAAAASAAAILLGTKLGRRLTGAALKVGTVAALGKIGLETYQKWQAEQTGNAIAAGPSIGQLPEAEANQRSLALLKAMISAAKADGHIDGEEQATIKSQMEQLGVMTSTAEILQSEMQKPVDVAAIAQLADSQAAAVEMYLVSRMVVNVANDAERAYLGNLAIALKLAPELVAQLDSDAA